MEHVDEMNRELMVSQLKDCAKVFGYNLSKRGEGENTVTLIFRKGGE